MKTKTFWAMVLTLSMLSATVDARDYDITAYGAKSDTTVLSTQVLQQAPDARPDFVEEDTEGWGDQGNGTYRNPVLNADFSDPDVIRVGSKYYMVASTSPLLANPSPSVPAIGRASASAFSAMAKADVPLLMSLRRRLINKLIGRATLRDSPESFIVHSTFRVSKS